MKRLISTTLLVVIGVAGGLIYTSKPEAKAGFKSKSFRINLKDGDNAQGSYFCDFGSYGSLLLGKATGPNTNQNQNHLFDNWQGSLLIHFDANLKGPGLTQLYPIEIYAGGYDCFGYSDIETLTSFVVVNYDVDWFKQARNLSITNFDEVPILATEFWMHDFGYLYELDPYNPNNPDPNNLYWVAEGNSTNIDINVAVYPIVLPDSVLYSYGRSATPYFHY